MNTLKFITHPVLARSGQWAVAYGSLPKGEELYDAIGNIKRKHIESTRFFKRKGNAEKYRMRTIKEHWLEYDLRRNNQLN